MEDVMPHPHGICGELLCEQCQVMVASSPGPISHLFNVALYLCKPEACDSGREVPDHTHSSPSA